MEFRSDGTQNIDQRNFHEMMHVLSLGIIEPGAIRFCATLDSIESAEYLRAFIGGKKAGAFKSLGPRTIESEFVRQQSPVESPRALKFVERRVGTALESAAPHFIVAGIAQRRESP